MPAKKLVKHSADYLLHDGFLFLEKTGNQFINNILAMAGVSFSKYELSY